MAQENLRRLSAEEQYAAIEKLMVQRLMTVHALSEQEISRTSCLKDDLGLDSLDFIELIINIEKETEIHVSDDEINHNEDTVDSLVKTFVKNIHR